MVREDEPASPSARLMQEPGFNLCIFVVMGYKTLIDVELFKRELERTLIKHPRFSSVLSNNNILKAAENSRANLDWLTLIIIWVPERKTCKKSTWKRVTVNVDEHVFEPDLDLGPESPDEFIENFTSELSKTRMDPFKPLWDFHIFNARTSDAESTAIFRIHHSLGDGVSLISLLVACSTKTSDPGSLPALPSVRRVEQVKHKELMMKRMFLFIWTVLLIFYNTLIDCTMFVATVLFVRDTRSLIKGGRRNAVAAKRFVHRIVKLEEVKLVKNAMGASINDVVLGVTNAGLSCYLNRRYEKQREKGVTKKITNYLPKNLYLRSAVVFNLRKSASIEDLAEMMEGEKELKKGMWGNLVGIVLLPFTIAMEDDPLTYVRRAKATMDGKKLSLAHKCSYFLMKLLTMSFGTKVAGTISSVIFRHTTLTFSNVVGPDEEINAWGHPLAYLAPSVHGFPQALIVHYQSYADKLIISIGADENIIPNPHELCDDLVKSLENIQEALMKKGLVEGLEASDRS